MTATELLGEYLIEHYWDTFAIPVAAVVVGLVAWAVVRKLT